MNSKDADSLNYVIRDEFLINLRKFMRFVSSTLEFVISEVKLPVPMLDLKDDPEENMKDEKLMAEIDVIVVQWNHQIEFDPFDPGCQSSWDTCLERFRQDVEKIKMDVKNCINNSFKSLRSSQGAFEMLQRFSSSQTEGDIASVFTEKFQDVLDQYEKELRLVETTFDEGVINAGEHEFTLGPKYLPKVSGVISFERQLFNRIKSPMVRFAQTKELTDTERGRQIRDRYICLARRMKTFEENIFADWKRRIAECLPGLLERKLWKMSDRQSEKRPSRPSLTLARLRTGVSSQTTDSTLTNTTRSGPLLPILDKNLCELTL
ncbi:Dynein heavy chain 10, axonemal [Sparganum proliferum]